MHERQQPAKQARTLRLELELAAGLFGACAKVPAEAPEAPVEPRPVARTQSESGPAPVAPEPAAQSWFEPLAPLTLDPADEAEKQQVRTCLEQNRASEPDVTAAEILAAANCSRDVPSLAAEIRLLKHLLTHFPNAEEVQLALVRLGQRYEQIDHRPQAIEHYLRYLNTYPKQSDARGVGKRAACLAWSLGTPPIEEILRQLDRLYARQGFSMPTDEELAQLCAQAKLITPD